jgi:hypothetical protein
MNAKIILVFGAKKLLSTIADPYLVAKHATTVMIKSLVLYRYYVATH